MKLAYTIAPGRGETNRLLANFADAMKAKGKRLAGTIQIDTPREKTHHCDMDVQILPDGPVIRISQDLGPEATGCRLNPHALEDAVAQTQKALEGGADIVIINKFGKHEGEGRGFREVVAEALASDIAVIVGVNKLNLDAFHEFSGGGAAELEPELDALIAWAQTLA